jgi:hypothetical protein
MNRLDLGAAEKAADGGRDQKRSTPDTTAPLNHAKL